MERIKKGYKIKSFKFENTYEYSQEMIDLIMSFSRTEQYARRRNEWKIIERKNIIHCSIWGLGTVGGEWLVVKWMQIEMNLSQNKLFHWIKTKYGKCRAPLYPFFGKMKTFYSFA